MTFPLSPSDIEDLQKVMEQLTKIMPMIEALLEVLPTFRVVKDLTVSQTYEGKKTATTYAVAILIEGKPKLEEKPKEAQ